MSFLEPLVSIMPSFKLIPCVILFERNLYEAAPIFFIWGEFLVSFLITKGFF